MFQSLFLFFQGILKNVSLECVLRPERRSDLIIVFDMNSYQSDEVFDYMVFNSRLTFLRTAR